MDYVLDFARALSGAGPSRGRRRGGAGAWVQLRVAILGIMLGLAIPSVRGVDWRAWLPAGVSVELPHGGKLRWPAGEIGLPDWNPPARGEAVAARFGRCGRGVAGDCVVDGDTFRLAGEKVRIADIDTPETHPPRCAREARLGEAATRRLQALLNAGPVTLADAGRARDRYGRRLAIVERDGESLGRVLIDEGLARPWEGRRRPWC